MESATQVVERLREQVEQLNRAESAALRRAEELQRAMDAEHAKAREAAQDRVVVEQAIDVILKRNNAVPPGAEAPVQSPAPGGAQGVSEGAARVDSTEPGAETTAEPLRVAYNQTARVAREVAAHEENVGADHGLTMSNTQSEGNTKGAHDAHETQSRTKSERVVQAALPLLRSGGDIPYADLEASVREQLGPDVPKSTIQSALERSPLIERVRKGVYRVRTD